MLTAVYLDKENARILTTMYIMKNNGNVISIKNKKTSIL